MWENESRSVKFAPLKGLLRNPFEIGHRIPVPDRFLKDPFRLYKISGFLEPKFASYLYCFIPIDAGIIFPNKFIYPG